MSKSTVRLTATMYALLNDLYDYGRAIKESTTVSFMINGMQRTYTKHCARQLVKAGCATMGTHYLVITPEGVRRMQKTVPTN